MNYSVGNGGRQEGPNLACSMLHSLFTSPCLVPQFQHHARNRKHHNLWLPCPLVHHLLWCIHLGNRLHQPWDEVLLQDQGARNQNQYVRWPSIWSNLLSFSSIFFWLGTLLAASLMMPVQFPSTGLTGRAQVGNRASSGAFTTNEPAEPTTYDPLIGRKVWTRWPEDNHFYEAVITDYNRIEVSFLLLTTHYLNNWWAAINISDFQSFNRADMPWYMILIQQMKLGSGSISKR